MRKMDWSRLETRLRDALRSTLEEAKTGGGSWKKGIYRINAILDDETDRGEAIPESQDSAIRHSCDKEYRDER